MTHRSSVCAPFATVQMPPKANARDTPSPSKKRKTESTPVKRGVDFFFKKQLEKNQKPSPSNGELFVQSDEDEEWEVKRRLQEEEDERLARELQDMEVRME